MVLEQFEIAVVTVPLSHRPELRPLMAFWLGLHPTLLEACRFEFQESKHSCAPYPLANWSFVLVHSAALPFFSQDEQAGNFPSHFIFAFLHRLQAFVLGISVAMKGNKAQKYLLLPDG